MGKELQEENCRIEKYLQEENFRIEVLIDVYYTDEYKEKYKEYIYTPEEIKETENNEALWLISVQQYTLSKYLEAFKNRLTEMEIAIIAIDLAVILSYHISLLRVVLDQFNELTRNILGLEYRERTEEEIMTYLKLSHPDEYGD